jgi:hypothetical protein
LMLKYQDFDLCRHLTGSSLRRRNSSATWRAKALHAVFFWTWSWNLNSVSDANPTVESVSQSESH